MLGVDAIGLVFFHKSMRHVNIEQARVITDALPPFVTVVGLFVNSDSYTVNEILNNVPIDVLQFHGEEHQAFCSSFDRPYIKAVRVRQGSDIIQAAQTYKNAQGLLLDAWHPDEHGGTGLQFDWSMLKNAGITNNEPPFILAGGLCAANVCMALETARVYAVDVSSGVETDKGIKDSTKIQEFINEVNRFDITQSV